MDLLILVAALAGAWHVGLALLERRRRPGQYGPSLARLLLLAEVEVLRTLRAELKRGLGQRREGRQRKLSRVEARLKELGDDGA